MVDIDKIGLIAQEISFAFEDDYYDEAKRKVYVGIFNRYLSNVDPGVMTDPYDAIIALGRSNPDEFEEFLKDIREKKLVNV